MRVTIAHVPIHLCPFAANHPAARRANVRDVAQTSGTPSAQSVRVQRHQRRRVFGRARARRGTSEAGPRRAGSFRLRVSEIRNKQKQFLKTFLTTRFSIPVYYLCRDSLAKIGSTNYFQNTRFKLEYPIFSMCYGSAQKMG